MLEQLLALDTVVTKKQLIRSILKDQRALQKRKKANFLYHKYIFYLVSFFKMGYTGLFFLYFRLFNTVDNKQNVV